MYSSGCGPTGDRGRVSVSPTVRENDNRTIEAERRERSTLALYSWPVSSTAHPDGATADDASPMWYVPLPVDHPVTTHPSRSQSTGACVPSGRTHMTSEA